MNGLTKSWISFFHNSSLPGELLYDIYRYLSAFTYRAAITIEELETKFSISGNVAIKLIKDLRDSELFIVDSKCPYCGGNINIEEDKVSTCKSCGNEYVAKTVDIGYISEKASIKSIIQKKYEDEVYELNAEILVNIGKTEGKLYYLITDIEDSQTKQRNDSNQYSIVLNRLWSDIWPSVFHISKKASLPLLARGDSVSIVFANIEDVFETVKQMCIILKDNKITELSIYGSEIIISEGEKLPFMRSIDKKWDLNSPSVTDLYRKTSFKPLIWENAKEYCVKYCFFDNMSNLISKSKFYTANANSIEHYKTEDKHGNKYSGNCFAGYY